ncbi:MAG TPA: hypothetical protein DDX92_13560 [Flavobacteriales bacterium]|nr:hypothetical protein [Flavobacteriales bacterium]
MPLKNFNHRKNTRFLLILTLAFVAFSCSKDDENTSCTAPAVEENIIGTWTNNFVTGDVEFKTDGTYTDDNEVFFGYELNGVVYDDRRYNIVEDTLNLSLFAPSGTDSAVVFYLITDNKCNNIEISFDFGGTLIPLTLNRK